MLIRLEPAAEAHLAGVEALVGDPLVARFTRLPDPPPPDYARTWLARYAGREDRAAFAALDEAGEFLGLALAPDIDRDGLEAELGYTVAPTARGRGAGTAMLRALTEWAFADLGMQRLTLIIDVDNAPSIAIARRCGYTLEGVMRSIAVKQGRRTDAGLWSRLPTDPVR